MSVEQSLELIVSKLNQLADRLGGLEQRIGSGNISSTTSSSTTTSAPTGGAGEDGPTVAEFLGLVAEFVPKIVSSAEAIGGEVHKAVCLL